MRFLILSQYFYPEIGAAQVRLAAFARTLQQLGHEVEIVTALPNYPHGRIFPHYRGKWQRHDTWEGMTVHRYWCYAATGAGLKRLWNYASFMLSALFGIRRVKKPDYIFVESPPLFLGITAFLYAKYWRVPFIFNVADLWPDSVQALGLMNDGILLRFAFFLEKKLYQKAHFVNAVTDGTYQVLQSKKQLPANKLLFLPNGVDTETFYPRAPDEKLKRELSLPDYEQLILYAGTHGYAHGMDVLLEAAHLLRNKPYLFVLIGGGSEKIALQQKAAQLQLSNVLFFEPRPPETIAAWYSLATLGVSTLRAAPLFDSVRPVKILACMACGKPVVYSGQGEGADLVRRANAGVIVPPEDAPALAEAMENLLQNPDKIQELGKNGRQFVLEQLQWSAVIERWLAQLQNAEEQTRTAV
ncbi:glycosyltransferase family 4 protein [Thioflexithrix psekupsensis]|uniref:Glycosyltransferase WbuB n=1 Tax=Thioflexithrix psekupsensis TaxID=1570016 RepID=A0A251X5F7_9GAMM|nr:glycosyltransferase family 4 protein [Thioflexithrix psekupsensis]OUD12585.1 glycosyltransferase WbuB [Thioflexithrix psekupsensis]